jgi:nucleotide-binding universal stress UspA family protein
MFSIIVIMAVTTSLMAPTGLRWILKNVQPGEEEAKRLRLEALAEGSLIANIHRVLLPVRQRETEGRAVQTIEAHVLEKLGAKTELSLTLLNVAGPGGRADSAAFLQELSQMFSQKEVLKKAVEGAHPADVILDEAQKEYDLLVLGSSEENREQSGAVFTPLVDDLVRLAPCPTMIVQGKRVQPDWSPRRFLVPTNGSAAARNAAELGFALASDETSGEGDEVLILHVVIDNTSRYFLDAEGETLEKQLAVGRQMVAELQELGQARGVDAGTQIRVGVDPETIILDTAREYNIDLIILGTDVRPFSQRLFLGPRVERILRKAPCPVIVLND